MMLKNFLFYAFSTFINTWAAEQGGGEVFKVFGIVSVVLITLCIPMCKSFISMACSETPPPTKHLSTAMLVHGRPVCKS